MTSGQIKALGIDLNKWVTLEGKFSNILLHSDSYLFPVPTDSQYYFDSKDELLFVRYTFPHVVKEKRDDTFVKVEFLKEGICYLKLLQGGVNDSVIGTYHEVFDFNALTSFQ